MQAAAPISKSYRRHLKFTVVSQVLMLVLTGFMADFGVMFTWLTYSVFTFWAVASLIMIRRWNCPTPRDLLFIRYGFWIIAFTYILAGQHIYEQVQRGILTVSQ